MTTPMTAAEYRVRFPNTIANGWDGAPAILAALEEREALLGKLARATRARTEAAEVRRLGESDASVGALVRRIGELQPSAYLTWAGHPMCYYVKHPSVLQSALDSLLPKEPEVVTAPSGWRYEYAKGYYVEAYDGQNFVCHIERDSSAIPPIDRDFVAALLARQEGKGHD